MQLAHSCRLRLELTPAHRALVLGALLFHTGLLVWALAEANPAAAGLVLVLGGPPAVLLALREHPHAFRLLAALLAVAYVGLFTLYNVFGGVFFLPAALAMLWAAMLPRLPSAPVWRRAVCYLGVVVTGLSVPVAAVTLYVVLAF